MNKVLAMVVGSMLLASPVLACSGNKAEGTAHKDKDGTKTADKNAGKKDGKTTT